jgi:hypothetical protein
VTGLSYDDLVTSATVGLSRRPLQITELAGPAAEHIGVLDAADPAAAILDAAALLVAARRAGTQPALGINRPSPAAADTRPELSARAAAVLEQTGAADPVLLADLLTAAANRAYRAPAPLLPALLDVAARNVALRPPVTAVLGARGRWLAAYRADWQRVIDTAGPGRAVPGAAAPDAAAGAGDSSQWETGRRADRRAYLVLLRGRDPAAARDLLAAGWSRETGDDRAELLGVLARGLSTADEEFLEAALVDRKAAVRTTAAQLLAQLPGSAFTCRAAERAAALLRVERHGLRRRLTARLPAGPDPAAVRDGVGTTPPPPGIPASAWLLSQLIAAAPLSGWVTRFGLDAGQIVSLPVEGNLGPDVHAGWRRAAISQARPEWAAALLAAGPPSPTGRPDSAGGRGTAGGRPAAAWPPDHELAAVLPADARAVRAATLLAGATVSPAAIAEITNSPGPWPDLLADAVLATLGRMALGQGAAAHSRWPAALATAAARNLPVTGPGDHAAALERLADADTCPPTWSLVLRRTAGTLALRRAFLEEIH